MGFVGLHFHNASASTAVGHISLKKFQIFPFFQKYNKSVCISSKAYIDTLLIFTVRAREDLFCFHFYDCKLHAHLKPFQKLHTESQFGPIDNHHKTKVEAYNDKLPWGCRRSQSWKGSATKIPCQADPGLRQVLPVGIELSILRPGLVYQSQECSTHI